jgi:hypothetical protein
VCFVMHATLLRARETLMSIYITTPVHLITITASVFCSRVRNPNEKHIDRQTAFANYCAIQSIDPLSDQHSHHTSPPHLHRSSQDTNRSNSPMHPHRKSPHISNPTLENPYRLRINFPPSFTDRSLHHHCISHPLAIPSSRQFDPLFCHLQKGIYD